LSALASALAEGGDIDLEFGASKLSLHVPDRVHSEVEVDGDEIELELEMKWSTAKVAEKAEKPGTEKPADGDRRPPARRRLRRAVRAGDRGVRQEHRPHRFTSNG
jgi:amphi-Trp domain-containing protein